MALRKVNMVRPAAGSAAGAKPKPPVVRPPVGKPATASAKPKPGAAPAAGKSQAVRGRVGAAGFSNAKVENERTRLKREQGLLPWRLRLRAGEETNVIILDAKPFFFYEHNWQGASGKWDEYAVCIKDSCNCPACSKLNREGYYCMMLTCIDKREYTDKHNVVHTYSQKLLPVKSTMIPKFERLYKNNGETFRGMEVTLIRDSDNDSAIGGSVEFVKFVPEATLAKLHVKDKDGKAKLIGKPVDYDKAFPYPTSAELRNRIGGGAAQAGSEDSETDLGEVNWDE